MYDDPTFRPTTAETVIVHMVFAIMFFQYAARNWEDVPQQTSLNHKSNMHYHYSLAQFYQLSCSHTVQDVQALTLICSHLRNFPKPGASWILTQTTMSLAVELGLHRSSKRWAPDTVPNPLDVEMRKRTFWALLAIQVTLSGKLGRPMPFRMDDFDVEMPENIDDVLLSENGLDTSRPGKCLHEIGLQAIRLLPLYMELYSTIYAVRRAPENYISTINRLEAKLRTWREGLPPDLVRGQAGKDEQEGRIFALYAQMWALEFRLLLRHPSVSATTDPSFNAESMRICVESSRQMLRVVRQLQKFRSLDTTWYNSAVYVMAITTTLFAQWDKRSETSAADLAALKEEMDIWLDIMGDVGSLLGMQAQAIFNSFLTSIGSGNRLREAVRVVTDGTLGLLSRSLPGKPPSFTANNGTIEESKPPAQTSDPESTYNTSVPPQGYSYSNNQPTNGSTASSSYIAPESAPPLHESTPYPAATQYSTYPDQAPTIAYTPTQTSNSYTAYPHHTDAAEAPLLAAFAAQASQAHANQTQSQWRASSNSIDSTSQAWQQWTSTMAGNLEPQDCYSANALMQLGGRDLVEGSSGGAGQQVDAQAGVGVGQLDHSHMAASVGMGGTWPLNIFDIGHGQAGS